MILFNLTELGCDFFTLLFESSQSFALILCPREILHFLQSTVILMDTGNTR